MTTKPMLHPPLPLEFVLPGPLLLLLLLVLLLVLLLILLLLLLLPCERSIPPVR